MAYQLRHPFSILCWQTYLSCLLCFSTGGCLVIICCHIPLTCDLPFKRRSRLYLLFYSLFYKHIKYQLSNMVKIKRDINQQDFKIVDHHFVKYNLDNFLSLEVVDRVSETQLQVGKKFRLENLAVKGLNKNEALSCNIYVPFFCILFCKKQFIYAKKKDANKIPALTFPARTMLV